MKTRSFVSVLLSIVLVLLLAGGAGAYWLVSRNPLMLLEGVEPAAPGASVFVSRQSPVVVSLLVHPDRLSAFGLAITPPSQRKRVQAQWQHFRQELFGNSQFDYKQDIQPWLGNELTFAVTTPDIDRDITNGEQPGYLLAAAVRDAARAEQSIQTYWQRQATKGVDLTFEQFAGVNLVYGNPAEPLSGSRLADGFSSLATAQIGDRFVLFANQPKVLRDAINNLQVPELSLSQSESYQQALQHLSQPHIGVAFVHLPQLATWLGDTPTSPSPLASPTFDSLLMALQLDEQGIIADTQLLTAPDKAIKSVKPTLSQPVQSLQYVPATSPFVVAGRDLQQGWTQLEAGLEGYEPLQTLLHRPLDPLVQRWGIDLAEIVGWVKDEYVLGLLPRADGSEADWIFVTKQSPNLSNNLAQLDQKAQQQGISTGHFTIADQPVTAWTKLSTVRRTPSRGGKHEVMTVQAEVQGVHASVGEYEIFATSLDAISQALEANQNSLFITDRFQQEIAALPSPNNGYLFVDWMSLKDELNLSSSPLSELKDRLAFLEPVMDELRTLTFSSDGSSTHSAQGTVFLRL
jgi:hypothetical protein